MIRDNTYHKTVLFRHSLSDEIEQAKVLSAIQTIVAFSTCDLKTLIQCHVVRQVPAP